MGRGSGSGSRSGNPNYAKLKYSGGAIAGVGAHVRDKRTGAQGMITRVYVGKPKGQAAGRYYYVSFDSNRGGKIILPRFADELLAGA